jgi:uncharacterized repeat protein (TIGR01451 family)
MGNKRPTLAVDAEDPNSFGALCRDLAALAVPSKWSVAIITSRLPPKGLVDDEVAEAAGNRLRIIDWFSYETERVIGVETEGPVLKCARDPLNVKVAFNKVLRAWKGRKNILVIADVVPAALERFGEADDVVDVVTAIRERAKKNGAMLVVAVNSAFSSAGKRMRGALPPSKAIDVPGATLEFLAAEESPAGQDEAGLSVSVCSACGAFFTLGKVSCPLCGGEPAGEGAVPSSKPDEETETPELCAHCGAMMPQSLLRCPNCGQVRAEPGAVTGRLRDVLQTTAMEIGLCPGCGAFVDRGKRECKICGQRLDPAEMSAVLHRVLTEDKLETVPADGLDSCAECGALVKKSSSSCMICGAGRTPGGAVRAVEKELEGLEALAKLIDENSCQRCGATVDEAGKCPVCGMGIEEAELDILMDIAEEALGEVSETEGSRELREDLESFKRALGTDRERLGERKLKVDRLDEAGMVVDEEAARDIEALGDELLELEKLDETEPAPAGGERQDDAADESAAMLSILDSIEDVAGPLDEAKDASTVLKILESPESPQPAPEAGDEGDAVLDMLDRLEREAQAPPCSDEGRDFEPAEAPVKEGYFESSIAEELDRLEGGLAADAMDSGLQPTPGTAEGQEDEASYPENRDDSAVAKGHIKGLTNGASRGMTNGLAAGSIRTGGLTNGAGKGRTIGILGRTNGLTNGLRGRVNGLTNGITNGRGKTNGLGGLTNGLTNGRGKTNGTMGATNGLTNGLRGRVNGLTNGMGRTNGLMDSMQGTGDFRGLVNGLGLTNGIGDYRSSRIDAVHGARRLRVATIWITMVALALLIVPLLSTMIVPVGHDGGIDGDFGEWGVEQTRGDTADDCPSAACDIVRGGVSVSEGRVSVFATLRGGVFAGESTVWNASSAIFAFIDSDADKETGYAISGIGADYLYSASGSGGDSDSRVVWRFDELASADDWNGFANLGELELESDGASVEFGAPIESASPGAICVIGATDGAGRSDILDLPLSVEGIASVKSRRGEPGDDAGLRSALVCEIQASETVEAEVELVFQGIGFVSGPLSSRPWLEISGEGISPTSSSDTELVFSLGQRAISDDEPLMASLMCILGAPNGTVAGRLLSAHVGGAPMVVTDSERFVIAQGTQGISIDGDFSDWGAFPLTEFAAGGAMVGARGPFDCPDIDLTGVATASMPDGEYVRLDVAGVALGGSLFPTLLPIAKGGHRPSPAFDTDLDGVPDALDTHPEDFDNDGTADSAEWGDRDGDGVADWPAGGDVWLNTTVPDNYPAPYGGREVAIFIGPVSQEARGGEDIITVYQDTDGDSGTGIPVRTGFGADRAIIVRGSRGSVASARMYTAVPEPSPWSLVAPASAAALGGSVEIRAEAHFSPDGRLLVTAENWHGAEDSASAEGASSATRTPLNDNIVINEICSRPNPEWIELSNPTGAAINVGGWRVRVGLVYAYTYPAGTTVGAWGSGNEYHVTALPSNTLPNNGRQMRLYDSAGVLVDQTQYPTMADGQTWCRFKHEDTGVPLDTDTVATDWYISNNNWIIPEGPTMGTPNARKMPILNMDKTTISTEVEAGESLTHSLWYNNTGDGNAKSVWVNDTLPVGTSFISSAPPPLSVAGGIVTWFFPSVAHDTVNLISVTVHVNISNAEGTVLTNVADVQYRDALGQLFSGARGWANVTVRRPTIVVEKVANVSESWAGSQITYTLFYNNTGSRTAAHVWLNDTILTGMSFVSSSVPPSATNGSSYTWHLTDVSPGLHSISIVVAVSANATSGASVNTAQMNYTNSAGTMIGGSWDDATVIVPEFGPALTVPPLVLLLLLINSRRRKS